MLRKLLKMATGASLLLTGSAYAEAPDLVLVDFESGVALYYSGNENAPPPIVIVDGVLVGRDGDHGSLDCAKTENRPVCETLQFVNELDACVDSAGAPTTAAPDFIVITPDGKGAHIYCAGNEGAPPPYVIVNGVVVNNP